MERQACAQRKGLATIEIRGGTASHTGGMFYASLTRLIVLQHGRLMRTFAVGLLSAAALTATILLVRQQRDEMAPKQANFVPAGENQPARISLDRIRELGL